MKRSFFIVSAAIATSIGPPLLGRSEDLTKRVGLETNVEAPGHHKPMWFCGSAVVWLNAASGIYYYKGDRWYGRTQSGAYTCERQAMNAGGRASLDGVVA